MAEWSDLDDADLDRLKVSPEVAWYCEDRGIGVPDCPPLIKTPEPRDEPGAAFDPERVDKVLAVFASLQHTKGRLAGKPLKPDPWQVVYILAPVFGWVHHDDDLGMWVRIIRTLYVDLPRKNGKALDVDTPILTGRGWLTMGDVKVGDQVHGPDGLFTEVVATSEVLQERRCYEVEFSSGQKIVADADHLWTLHDRWRKREVTVDTETVASNYLIGNRETHRERRYSVSVPDQLQRPDLDLPVDPYLLGAWLGDGHTAVGRITGVDPEVIAVFAEHYSVRRTGSSACTWSITGGFTTALRKLGVLGDKHVPESYLVASATQRLELLRGLMDTDGCVTASGLGRIPRCEFTSTNRGLAEAALYLARSLGWKATLKTGRATLYGKDCGAKYRVTWTAYREQSPFRLARKTERLRPDATTRTRTHTLQVVSVREVASRATRCIQVARPDGLYLAGDGLVPTHNSTLSGGIGIYLTCADNEEGAQVVAAATRLEQAQFVFAPIKQLAEKSPRLRKHTKAFKNKIVHKRTGSYLQAVANAGDAQHGADLHGGIIDELHLHKTNDLVEALETGTGSRAQPLITFITTADASKKDTPYDRKRKLVEQLARRVLKDPTVYGVVWGAEVDDDPFSEETQRKANPGFGISPTRAFLRQAAAKAQQSEVEKASYLRLHLGIRTKQQSKFLNVDRWDDNASMVLESRLKGRACFGGLDLAATSDLSALCWVFPDDEFKTFDLLWRLWTPEANVESLDARTAGMASIWAKNGVLTVTPGNVADYDFIQAQVKRDSEVFDVREVAYDRWNSTQLVNNLLADGAPMVTMGQGFASMSSPTKELQRLVLLGTPETPILRHGGNPAMRWMVDNFAVVMDPAGNVKPDKANAADKIDGVVALIMGLSRAIEARPEGESAYKDHDLMIV